MMPPPTMMTSADRVFAVMILPPSYPFPSGAILATGAYCVVMSDRTPCLDNPILAEHLEEIRALCQEFGVLRLEVFGSVCTPEFNPERSDVDFLVEYPEGYVFGPWLARLFALEDALELVVGRKVDVVMPKALRNKWFRREADKTRVVIYDAREVAEVA